MLGLFGLARMRLDKALANKDWTAEPGARDFPRYAVSKGVRTRLTPSLPGRRGTDRRFPGGSGRLRVRPGAGLWSRRYQLPVLAIEAQGSACGRASPFWISSIEMPSGERTKAMWPSRGGRLMTTPMSDRCWHRA